MASKSEKINQALVSDYLGDYTEILGICVGITEYYPQQADSQIRNALTHLSRAASSDEVGVVDKQIRAFKAHVERAKRDCLKLAITEKKGHISDHIKSIHFARGGLPLEIMERRLEASLLHKQTFIHESKGMEDVASEMEIVLTKLMELEKHLIEFDKIAYQPSHSVYMVVRFIQSSKKISSIIGMIFLVALASYGLEKLLPFLSTTQG